MSANSSPVSLPKISSKTLDELLLNIETSGKSAYLKSHYNELAKTNPTLLNGLKQLFAQPDLTPQEAKVAIYSMTFTYELIQEELRTILARKVAAPKRRGIIPISMFIAVLFVSLLSLGSVFVTADQSVHHDSNPAAAKLARCDVVNQFIFGQSACTNLPTAVLATPAVAPAPAKQNEEPLKDPRPVNSAPIKWSVPPKTSPSAASNNSSSQPPAASASPAQSPPQSSPSPSSPPPAEPKPTPEQPPSPGPVIPLP